MTSLFRKEAIEAQQDKLHGTVLLARIPSFRMLTVVVITMVSSALFYAVLGEYTRKEHVSGFLAPSKGLIKLYTPQVGTILVKNVNEGQLVKKGDVLFILSSDRSTIATQGAQAAMAQQLSQRKASLLNEKNKQAEIDALTTRGLTERISGLDAELRQALLQLDLQGKRYDSATQELKRYEEMAKSQYADKASLQKKQDEALDQRSRLADIERAITNLRSDIKTAKVELESSKIKQVNNGSTFDRQISEIEQQLTESETRQSVVISAPADGVVTTILAEVGQMAQLNSPLASLLPQGSTLEAHLLVPTRAAGFIRPDQAVALRYQAFPYQRFGHYNGRVTEVSRNVIQPNETVLPISVVEPVYRVTVHLDEQAVNAYGQRMDLQAGMTLDADVYIDRRRIIEWIFDPVLAVTGRV